MTMPLAEPFFGALKNERVSRITYSTREEAKQDITRYIEFWYNRKRLHSALGDLTPHEAYPERCSMQLAA
ncbi:IS3 family transposase [Streptomyces sp. NPDC008121]|uniref:IS3 family transposase n=1 Tax=Streptomyces sp. NPDC008121 TaxID=3364809 RepID=UPI0036E87072